MTPCNRCAQPIEFGEMVSTGQIIPLDVRTEVYTFSGISGSGGRRKIVRLSRDEAMARHICAVKVPIK